MLVCRQGYSWSNGGESIPPKSLMSTHNYKSPCMHSGKQTLSHLLSPRIPLNDFSLLPPVLEGQFAPLPKMVASSKRSKEGMQCVHCWYVCPESGGRQGCVCVCEHIIRWECGDMGIWSQGWCLLRLFELYKTVHTNNLSNGAFTNLSKGAIWTACGWPRLFMHSYLTLWLIGRLFYVALKMEVLNFNVVKLIVHSIYSLDFFLLFKKFFFTVRSWSYFPI